MAENKDIKAVNGVETDSITQEDISNLNAIFALARQSVATNEEELIKIIKFRQMLTAKLLKQIKTDVRKVTDK